MRESFPCDLQFVSERAILINYRNQHWAPLPEWRRLVAGKSVRKKSSGKTSAGQERSDTTRLRGSHFKTRRAVLESIIQSAVVGASSSIASQARHTKGAPNSYIHFLVISSAIISKPFIVALHSFLWSVSERGSPRLEISRRAPLPQLTCTRRSYESHRRLE